MKDKRNDIFCLALQSLEFSIIYHDILDDMESPDIDNHYRPSLGVVGQIQSGSRESYSSNASDHSTTKVQRERERERLGEREIRLEIRERKGEWRERKKERLQTKLIGSVFSYHLMWICSESEFSKFRIFLRRKDSFLLHL